MNFNSINTSQQPPFIAFPATSDFLSDIELNQILDQPYASAENNYLSFGPPPKLPLLPQFAYMETPKTQETKKRKKEDEVQSAEVPADQATKKKKPANLTDRNIEAMSESDQLIDAIVDVIIRDETSQNASKKCNRSLNNIRTYVNRTLELLGPSTGTNETSDPTCLKIIEAAVAECQTAINEDPSLKSKIDKKIANYISKVNEPKKKKSATKNINGLIDAISSVVIYGKNQASIAKQYKISQSSLSYYSTATNQSLHTHPRKKNYHTRDEVVDAAVAQCLKLRKEDPSLKIGEEKKRERNALRVEALLQAIKDKNPSNITDDQLKKIEWTRVTFEGHARVTLRCVEDIPFPARCHSLVKEAVIKYRELEKSQD